MTPDEKLAALIKFVKEIDKKDMKLHNKKFKHVLYHQSDIKVPRKILVLNEDLKNDVDIKYLHIFDQPKKAIKLATRLCGRSLIVYKYLIKTQVKFKYPRQNAKVLKEMIWDVPRPRIEIINNEAVVIFDLYSKLTKREIAQLAKKIKVPIVGGAEDEEPEEPIEIIIKIAKELKWITSIKDDDNIYELLRDESYFIKSNGHLKDPPEKPAGFLKEYFSKGGKSVNITWNKPPHIEIPYEVLVKEKKAYNLEVSSLDHFTNVGSFDKYEDLLTNLNDQIKFINTINHEIDFININNNINNQINIYVQCSIDTDLIYIEAFFMSNDNYKYILPVRNKLSTITISNEEYKGATLETILGLSLTEKSIWTLWREKSKSMMSLIIREALFNCICQEVINLMLQINKHGTLSSLSSKNIYIVEHQYGKYDGLKAIIDPRAIITNDPSKVNESTDIQNLKKDIGAFIIIIKNIAEAGDDNKTPLIIEEFLEDLLYDVVYNINSIPIFRIWKSIYNVYIKWYNKYYIKQKKSSSSSSSSSSTSLFDFSNLL